MRAGLSLIFFISIIFAVLAGSGVYGYGNDFYAAYHKPNLDWGGTTDYLGFRIATLTIYGTHLGVYIVSFLISCATGLLLYISTYQSFTKKYKWLFYVLFIILIHTWPVIMSTSNGMRQGLSMTFLFLALYFSSTKNYLLFIVTSIIAALMHKSGIVFTSMLFISGVTIYFFYAFKLNIFLRRILLLIMAGVLAISLFIFIEIYFPNREDSHIINNDFRYPFLMINFIYVFFFMKTFIKQKEIIYYYLFFLSCTLPIFLLQGFNWEYERLNMMIIIPYLISFSSLFILQQRKIILTLSLTSLLMLTLYVGIYDSMYSSYEDWLFNEEYDRWLELNL